MACQRPVYQPLWRSAPLYKCFVLRWALSLSTTPMIIAMIFHFLPAEARSTSSTQQAAKHPVRQCTSPCTQHGIQSGCGVTVSSRGERHAKNGADGLSMQPPSIPMHVPQYAIHSLAGGCSDQQSCQLSLKHMRAVAFPFWGCLHSYKPSSTTRDIHVISSVIYVSPHACCMCVSAKRKHKLITKAAKQHNGRKTIIYSLAMMLGVGRVDNKQPVLAKWTTNSQE